MVKIMGLISANYGDDAFGYLTAERTLVSLPFGGRYRLIDFALSNMVNSGIRAVGIITPHNYRSIIDHIGAGKEWSLDRKVGGLFILPGTSYGIKHKESKFLLRDVLENRIFFDRGKDDLVYVTSGNQIMNIDIRKIAEEHVAKGAGITLLYKNVEGSKKTHSRFLEVDEDGKLCGVLSENPVDGKLFIDSFIINRKLAQSFMEWYGNADYLDFMDIVAENLDKIEVDTHEVKGYVSIIDSVEDYVLANCDLLKDDIRKELLEGENKIYTKIQDAAPAKYKNGAKISNSIVTTGCVIEGTVENSILFRGVTVAKGAVVKNSIIMQRSVIEKDAVLENVITDKQVKISAGTKLYGTEEKPVIMAKQLKF